MQKMKKNTAKQIDVSAYKEKNQWELKEVHAEPELDEEALETESTSELADNYYTYIGNGATPPEKIDFMGLQTFYRGEPVKVVNPVLLRKIEGHPCFTKGEFSRKELAERDEAEAAREKLKEIEAQQIEAAQERRNRTYAY